MQVLKQRTTSSSAARVLARLHRLHNLTRNLSGAVLQCAATGQRFCTPWKVKGLFCSFLFFKSYVQQMRLGFDPSFALCVDYRFEDGNKLRKLEKGFDSLFMKYPVITP
jgi:hypothetical protein